MGEIARASFRQRGFDAGGDLDSRSGGKRGGELHRDVRGGAEAAVRVGDRAVFVPVRDGEGSRENDERDAEQGDE